MAHAIIITDAGLETVEAADKNGFLISVSEFAVTLATDVVVSPDDTTLAEEVFYRSTIDEVVRVSGSTVKFKLTIPRGLPVDGSTVRIGEVALYTADNVMMAHGKFNPTLEKMSKYDSSVWIYATCRRLGDVINLSSGIFTSMPHASKVATLPAPWKSDFNVVGVSDQIDNTDGHQSAGIAVKYGPNGRAWSFSGYTRLYTGNVTPTDHGFDLDAHANGFWLNDQEEVIVQVLYGKSRGESRRVQYTGTFVVLDKELPLDAASIIAIWRSNHQQLPTRDPKLSPYCVLGIGLNDWVRTVKRRPESGYSVKTLTGMLPAGMTHIAVQDIDLDPALLDVWVDGKFLPPNSWMYSDGGVEVQAVSTDREFNVDVFTPTTTGGVLHCFEITVQATSGQTRFQMPCIADSAIMLVNGKRVACTIDTHDAVASIPILATDRVSLLAWLAYDQRYTAATRSVLNGQCVANHIAVDVIADEVQTVLFIGDEYIPRDDYVRTDEEIVLMRAHADGPATVITVIDTDGFNLELTQNQEGNNTGPQWVDPAGVEAAPCKVSFKRYTYTSDGTETVFKCASLRNKNYALIHVAGVEYDPSLYEYTATANAIITKSVIPADRKIDIFCISTEDAADDIGDEIFFRESTYLSGQNSGNYGIPLGAGPDNTLVWADGKFIHNDHINWNADYFRITSSIPSGLNVYVWMLTTAPRKNYTTLVMREKQEQIANQLIYQFVNEYEKRGLLLFSSYVHQLPSVYGLENQHEIVIQVPTQGIPLSTFYIRNLEPRTRLIKRDEFDLFRAWVIEELKKYMPLHGPYVKWSNLTKQLIQKLACPIVKLNMVANGSLDKLLEGSGKDKDSVDLATAIGLKPVRKSLTMDVLQTASYGSVGASTALGVPTKFNLYQYLEIYLRDQLGTDSFTIKKWEKGKKYIIDDIDVSKLTYESISRGDLPKITKATVVYTPMAGAIASTTHAGMVLGSTIHELDFIRGMPMPVNPTVEANRPQMDKIKTLSVNKAEDPNNMTYTHVIDNGFDGQTYTVVWRRPRFVDPKTYETDYMILVDAGGAPKYIQAFARYYAQFNYNDVDIRNAIFFAKCPNRGYANQALDIAWGPGGTLWFVYADPNYLKSAGYTAGIAFGASINNINKDTGDAELLINLTSGTIGYSQMPANTMMKKMQLPVEYTIYPGIIVNPDGTTDVVLSDDDLFDSCCWGDFDAKTTLDCNEPEQHI